MKAPDPESVSPVLKASIVERPLTPLTEVLTVEKATLSASNAPPLTVIPLGLTKMRLTPLPDTVPANVEPVPPVTLLRTMEPPPFASTKLSACPLPTPRLLQESTALALALRSTSAVSDNFP